MHSIFDYFKIPLNFFQLSFPRYDKREKGFFLFNGKLCYGVSNGNLKNSFKTSAELYEAKNENSFDIPFDYEDVIENFLYEKYLNNSISNKDLSFKRKIIRHSYYLIRPLMNVAIRRWFQRLSLRNWKYNNFPNWPVDFSVQDLYEEIIKVLMIKNQIDKIPFIWFWPKDYKGCIIMTHDVETGEGLKFCRTLMEIEATFDIKSSFEIVPEERYYFPQDLFSEMNSQGFEICLHGLNHDGHLFSDYNLFIERAKKINVYIEKWKVEGFRSPVMYRNVDWLPHLNVKYDMSFPNVGHLDPQNGGCCTVIPFFIDSIVEIPVTTTQDYPLYYILNQKNLDLWMKQTDLIVNRNGLISFIIHPDYTIPKHHKELYQKLLEYLKNLQNRDNLWFPLPREVSEWWKIRKNLELVKDENGWSIRGNGSERAGIAYIVLVDNKIEFELPFT